MRFAHSDFFIESKKRDYAWSMHKFHYHNSYEIYYLTAGKRTILFENKIYHMQPGDLLLMRPNILHRGAETDAHEKWGIEFSKNFLDRFFTESMQENLLGCYRYNMIRLTGGERERAEAMFEEIYGEYTGDGLCAISLARLLLALNDAGKRHEAEMRGIDPRPSKDPERLDRILSYIEENFSVIRSVDDIAERFYLNKSYLCRLFKKETNMTIMDYLYNYRVQQACERLTATNAAIGEISRCCGFENSSHFIKVFKSMLGCTPGRFRREHAEPERN